MEAMNDLHQIFLSSFPNEDIVDKDGYVTFMQKPTRLTDLNRRAPSYFANLFKSFKKSERSGLLFKRFTEVAKLLQSSPPQKRATGTSSNTFFI